MVRGAREQSQVAARRGRDHRLDDARIELRLRATLNLRDR
jgi:hypothetical protein